MNFDHLVTIEQLAVRELPMLYRVAKRLVRNPSAAEDLVAQTMYLAVRGWANFDGNHPRSWLIQIMKNAFLNSIRNTKAAPETVSLDEAEIADDRTWEFISQRSLQSKILEQLDSLPIENRLAIALCDIEELSYDEAALAMEIPIGTLRSRLFRGRRMLRSKLYFDNSPSTELRVQSNYSLELKH